MQMIFILCVLTLEELKIILEIDSAVKWNFKNVLLLMSKMLQFSRAAW